MQKILDPKTGLHVDPVADDGTIRGGLGGAPVALFSETTAPLTSGVVQVLPIKTLQLGFRAAYLIDEIRMVAYTEAALTSANSRGLAGSIAAKFETGAHAFSGGVDTALNGFSSGYIPLGAYAPKWDFGILSNSENDVVYGGVSGGVDIYRSFARVRWPLPKPLWMGPGDVLRCSVQRHPTFDAGLPNVNVQVSYIGRVVAPGAPPPALRQVPWVSYMQKLSSDAVASSNQEFRNPFTRPFMVQRLTYRTFRQIAAPASFTELLDINQTPALTPSYYESVLLEDSLGYQVTRDYVPVGHVFDMYRHAWTFSRPIGPKEQFNVKFQRSLAPSEGTTFVNYLGMVGYRDEVA